MTPRKTWLKVKRGLLAPKHREALGVRVWLYLYILDRADWETGKVYGWTDRDAADDLGMPWRTVQDQRQQLETAGYISAAQEGQGLTITIHRWTNPREYSGQVYNPSRQTPQDVGGDSDAPEGTESSVPSRSEGTGEGTTPPYGKLRTPSMSPHSSQSHNPGRARANGWGDLLAHIRLHFERSHFGTWIEGATLRAFDDRHIILEVGNSIAREWLHANLLPAMPQVFEEAGLPPRPLIVVLPWEPTP